MRVRPRLARSSTERTETFTFRHLVRVTVPYTNTTPNPTQEVTAVRRLIVGGIAAALFTVAAPVTAGASAPAGPAPSKVYVVHGLPLDNHGTKVDVYAGPAGAGPAAAGLVADNFTFGTTAGPLSLAPASYAVYVAAPTASDDGVLTSNEVLFSKTLAVPSGQNLSAVASFDAAGNPTINVFKNDTRPTYFFAGRLSIPDDAKAGRG